MQLFAMLLYTYIPEQTKYIADQSFLENLSLVSHCLNNSLSIIL